jgi:hypothetical protein
MQRARALALAKTRYNFRVPDQHASAIATDSETTTDARFPSGYYASPIFWLLAFLILNLSVPFFNIPNKTTAIIGAVALTFAYVCVVVFFGVSVGLKKLPIVHLVAWGVLSLAVWFALDRWIGDVVARPIIDAARATRTRPGGAQLLQLIAVGTVTDMALMCIAVCFGNVAARMIKTPNMLGPVCIVIALIDVWGVLFNGIVSQLMRQTPHIAAKAMTSGPKLGAASGSQYAIPLPDVGIGDYLFIGLLFGAVIYLGLNWRGAIKWVVPLMIAALLLIIFPQHITNPFTGQVVLLDALPGLLFIGLGVAIPNYQRVFQFTREEKFALLYAGIFVAILTGALYLGFKSVLPDKKPHTGTQSTQRN